MPHDDERQLSAKEVQLIGEILLPKFTEALREEFREVRSEFSKALDRQTEAQNEKIETLETDIHKEHIDIKRRLTRLERIAWKALVGYAVLVALVTLAWQMLKGWVCKKFGFGS